MHVRSPGDGALTSRPRGASQVVGTTLGALRAPPLPSGWSGTRVTVAAAAFWPNVTQAWRAVDDPAWRSVRRVAFLNAGEWCAALSAPTAHGVASLRTVAPSASSCLAPL